MLFVPHTFMPTAAGGLDPATTAWVNAVITNGGTVSAGRKTLVDTMIKGLKSDGVWAKLDRLWILAAENSQSALTDMVADALATANGSPSFTTDRGYTGTYNGAGTITVYINTGFNPRSGSPVYVQNSGHISIWSLTSGAENTQPIGNAGATNPASHIFPDYSGGTAYFRVNSNSGAGVASAASASTGTGHFIASRTSSTQMDGYLNGSSIATGSDTSGLPVNDNFLILGSNDPSTGSQTGSARQCAMSSIGSGLSSTDSSNLYNRLRTYMTAVGVP